VGDEATHVAENRRRAFEAFGRPLASLFDVWQVHGVEVARADEARPLHQAHQQADGMITDRPHITLLMRFADCVPILLYDPHRRVIGMAHAGWQGTVKRTAAHVVRAMQAEYGCRPADMLAGIGPSIGVHHYAVGPEVAAQVQAAFGPEAGDLLPAHDGGVQFDLWEANRLVLEQAGVKKVEIAGVCTACHTKDWYSHRAEKGRTGRFGAMLWLS
jgi:hypothetical protein